MKSKFTLVALLLVAFFAVNAQQLNNAGFETWTSPNNPDSWATWESTTGAPLGLVKKDTATKVEGAASVLIKTDSVQAGPNKLLIPGFVFYGTTSYAPPAPLSFTDAAFAFKPDTLWFAYKYTPAGADSAYLEISASGPTGTPVAGGLPLLSTQGQWALIYVPLTDNLANLPTIDSLSLFFTSSIGRGKQGSVLNVDAIRFGYTSIPSAINEVTESVNVTVFPNPASDVINVAALKNLAGYNFQIMDITGRVVSTTILTGETTSVFIADLAKGNYIYKITDKNNGLVKQNKFTIVK